MINLLQKITLVSLFISLNCFSALSASVDTIKVFSNSMKKQISAVIVRPKGYSESSKRFPVVYLLHGFGGNPQDWIEGPPPNFLGNLSDKYNYIFVCPDGSKSFYLDSPINKAILYETFMIKELIPWIDQKYKTVKERHGRAITGISMGGHGALYLALKHPNNFAAAGSTSGAIDLTNLAEQEWVSDEMIQILGKWETSSQLYRNYSIINMIDKFKQARLPVIIDCGLEDEFFSDAHAQLHKKLVDAKVPHDYIERSGKHDFAYWTNALEYHLLFFQKQMPVSQGTRR